MSVAENLDFTLRVPPPAAGTEGARGSPASATPLPLSLAPDEPKNSAISDTNDRTINLLVLEKFAHKKIFSYDFWPEISHIIFTVCMYTHSYVCMYVCADDEVETII
jgi:hypothetical protein